MIILTMEIIPNEIWSTIFSILNDVKEIIKLTTVSKLFMKTIKNHYWYFCVNVKNDIVLEYVLDNYKFKNLKINMKCNVNRFIEKLINCHTLDLSYTKVTDASVEKLINCHTLNLRETNITDASVEKLINCHSLDLRYTKVTDASVKKLRNNGVVINK